MKDAEQLRCELESLETKITAASTLRSSTVDGITVTYRDLPELRAERTRVLRALRHAEAVERGAKHPGIKVARME